MILLFDAGGNPFFVGVSDNRKVSVGGKEKGYILIPINNLHRFKRLTLGEIKALKKTNEIVKSLKNDEAIKNYLANDLKKMDLVFKREVTREEYLSMVK